MIAVDSGAAPALSRSERVIAGALYGLLGLAVTVMAWSFGHPTLSLTAFGLGVIGFTLAVFGLVMCDLARASDAPWGRTALVAAVAVVLLVAAHVTGASLRLRWALSKPAFVRVVAALPPPGTPTAGPPAVPSHIGTYRIRYAEAAAGGYLFYDADGGDLVAVGAGFAYLPNGVRAAPLGFEFRKLDGAWYTFVADS